MTYLDFSLAPRAIRMLALHGADALRPSFANGRYIAPLVPRRIAGDLRKRAIIRGTFGSFTYPTGGWDPAWDESKKMFIMKPHKGHLRDRDRETRAAKITNAMKGMPDRLLKYEAEAVERRPKKDITFMFSRMQAIAKAKSGVTGQAPEKLVVKAKAKKY